MRKRKMNRALVVALSVAMASSNIAPTVTYAAESSQIFEASEQEIHKKKQVNRNPRQRLKL